VQYTRSRSSFLCTNPSSQSFHLSLVSLQLSTSHLSSFTFFLVVSSFNIVYLLPCASPVMPALIYPRSINHSRILYTPYLCSWLHRLTPLYPSQVLYSALRSWDNIFQARSCINYTCMPSGPHSLQLAAATGSPF
jgi:hypothetical protein